MVDHVDGMNDADGTAAMDAETAKSANGRTKNTSRKAPQGKLKTTFIIDDRTAAIMDELMDKLGVNTRSQVLQRALLLTKVAADTAGDSHVVTISDEQETDKKSIILNL
ncbi:MAG: hypothetical protein ACFB6R_07185 [Alphaproteobacteria bacterium]